MFPCNSYNALTVLYFFSRIYNIIAVANDSSLGITPDFSQLFADLFYSQEDNIFPVWKSHVFYSLLWQYFSFTCNYVEHYAFWGIIVRIYNNRRWYRDTIQCKNSLLLHIGYRLFFCDQMSGKHRNLGQIQQLKVFVKANLFYTMEL